MSRSAQEREWEWRERVGERRRGVCVCERERLRTKADIPPSKYLPPFQIHRTDSLLAD